MRNTAKNKWKPSVHDGTLANLEEQSNNPQGFRLEHEFGCEDGGKVLRDTFASNGSTDFRSDGRD
jgi:hypothetical protein